MPPIFNRPIEKEYLEITVHDFQDLFEKFYAGVFRQVYFLTHDRTAAEDITQETFLKLYHSCPVSLKNPGAWLNRIAVNLTYNFLNGEKRRHVKEPLAQGAREQEPAEDTYLRREENALVREILNMMPVKERMCLQLRFSGYSYDEVAEILEMPRTSVGKTLARAQQKFREIYRQKGSEK